MITELVAAVTVSLIWYRIFSFIVNIWEDGEDCVV